MKILLIGCGNISRAWLSAVRGEEEVSVAGLVDISSGRAEKIAGEFKIEDAVISDDLEEALRKTKPDIVFNCTVPEAHFKTTSLCLESGCHVFSEKPMAASMEEAEALCGISDKTGKVLAVMQNRRFFPGINTVKKLFRENALGIPTTLNSDFYIGSWFEGFRKNMSHVLLLDMAVHTFDAARFLSGKDPVSVYCKEWNPMGSWFADGASAMAVFEMSGGLVYNYRGSWTSPGLNTSWESEWRVTGTSGSLLWDGGTQIKTEVLEKIPPSEGDSKVLEIPSEPDEPVMKTGHERAIIDFIECIRRQKLPQTHCRDNIKSLAMVFGAIESSEKDKKIRIGE